MRRPIIQRLKSGRVLVVFLLLAVSVGSFTGILGIILCVAIQFICKIISHNSA